MPIVPIEHGVGRERGGGTTAGEHEGGAIIGVKGKRLGEQRERVLARRPARPALEGIDRSTAQAGTLGQFPLGQSRGPAMLAEQGPKARRLLSAHKNVLAERCHAVARSTARYDTTRVPKEPT